jgi:hypothetical protein
MPLLYSAGVKAMLTACENIFFLRLQDYQMCRSVFVAILFSPMYNRDNNFVIVNSPAADGIPPVAAGRRAAVNPPAYLQPGGALYLRAGF